MKLIEYFLTNQDRPLIHKPLSYFDIYERYFRQYVGRSVKVLEIGIGQGGALLMWKRYFGDESEIVGIDINQKCTKCQGEGIRIYIGDQASIAFLNSVILKEKMFDIIIDDGGHMMNQQIASYKHLFQFVKEGGLYLCEDTGTSYRKEYRDINDTFIEMAKREIDKVNNLNIDLRSVHIHDSIIVFEKGKKQEHNTTAIGRAVL